ncbi:MAG: sigma-70 family RNA polymerase sigma factor [Clostridia bacterium]|nr:sigma-70 family RNA polymerase sigma factor [Clostridia bacterium]
MNKKKPKKVFILQNGEYIEITFSEYCRRAEIYDTYKRMLFLPLYGMLMEVTPLTHEEFYREERRQKYLREQSIENDDFSYHSLTTDEFNGEDIFIDEGVSVCEKAIENIMIKKLRLCLSKLNKRDLDLLRLIYYLNYSERQIAKMYDVSQNSIHKRKKRILQKLKKFLIN